MEGLTKQQIVLVALLISFVTSIATGIVTVALMDQAPPGVTQTINRVVERTIEKVVPAPSQNQSAAVVTKETIVVKEDDLVVSAVEKNSQSIVSIIKIVEGGNSKTETFVGNGLIVNKDGLVATDFAVIAPTLDENQTVAVQSFKAVLVDGTVLPLTIVPKTEDATLALLKPVLDEKTKKTIFVPAVIANSLSLKLGQTIIAMGGEKISVATGIVSNISHTDNPITQGDTATSTEPAQASKPSVIKTDISAPGKTLGAILVNLTGEVVGIHLSSASNSDSVFVSSSVIDLAIKAMGKI